MDLVGAAPIQDLYRRLVGRAGELLMWDVHRNVDCAAVPAGRTVVRFTFPVVPVRGLRWWLVLTSEGVDVCDVDPGYEVSLTVTAGLRHMVLMWRGDIRWEDALRSGAVKVMGPETLRRTVPEWLNLSQFAAAPRPG